MTAGRDKLHLCGENTAISNRGMEGAMEPGEPSALEAMSQLWWRRRAVSLNEVTTGRFYSDD
jgi:hypothetical protein